MSILSVIIPVYNEEKAINLILDKVQMVELIGGVQKEVIIVNDGSTDNTEKEIKDFIHSHPEFEIRYIVHEVNKGKGAAIQTGIKEATGDFIIIQDADLGYEPEEYNLLLKLLLNGTADVVYGSRFSGGKSHRIHLSWHSFKNKLLTSLSDMFSNLNLSDMETRYKMYKSDIIKNVSLVENHSGFEHKIIQRIARVDGIRIYEAGISYDGRTYDEVKKNKWQDVFRALYFGAKYRLTPGRKPVSKINSHREVLLPGKPSKMKGFLTLTLLAAIFFSTGFHNSAKHYRYPGFQSIFQSDGLGYYQYLPAVFLQHDIKRGQHYCVTLADGRLLNKYSIGVSYLQAPFFFMANVWQ
jgi:glycosyltransferase involved in cell wall biosynthesis